MVARSRTVSPTTLLNIKVIMMLISTHQKDNRKAEIHKDEVDFYVKLIENGILIETRKLSNKSIHYAESCAENYVERIGSFHI